MGKHTVGHSLTLSLSDSSQLLAAVACHSHGFSFSTHFCITCEGDHMRGRPPPLQPKSWVSDLNSTNYSPHLKNRCPKKQTNRPARPAMVKKTFVDILPENYMRKTKKKERKNFTMLNCQPTLTQGLLLFLTRVLHVKYTKKPVCCFYPICKCKYLFSSGRLTLDIFLSFVKIEGHKTHEHYKKTC